MPSQRTPIPSVCLRPRRVGLPGFWISTNRSTSTSCVSPGWWPRGLPVTAVNALGELVGRARIEGRVASEATLHRCRKSGRALSRSHSERVYGVARVLDAVGTAFHGDVLRIQDFLLRPHPLLGGESPLDLALGSAPGADAVLNLVWRAEAGVAV